MLQDGLNKSESYDRFKERVSSLQKDFDIGLFIYLAQKSLLWIILFFFLFGLTAFFYLRYTPPVFQSSSIVQIRSENSASQLLNVQSIYGKEDISQDIEFLRSGEFFFMALAKLPLSVSYYSQGKVLSSENYNSSPYNVDITVRDSSIFGVKNYIEFQKDSLTKLTYQLGEKIYTYEIPLNRDYQTEHFNIKIIVINYGQVLQEQDQLRKNDYFFTINSLNNITDKYYSQLDVSVVNAAAKTIKITFKDNNANKAAHFAEVLAEEFINFDMERRNQSSNRILEFIESQISMVYDRLKNSENSIQQFQKDSKIANNENYTSIYIERLNKIETEILGLELEENLLNEIEKKVIPNTRDEMDVYSIIPVLTGTQFEATIKEQITALHLLLRKREELLYQVTPSSETIKSLEYQITIQKKLLLESVKSLREKLKSNKKTLIEKSKEFEKSFQELPTKELEFSRLQRVFSINEKFYTMLLEKRTEFSIAKAGHVPQNIILERAKASAFPISPDKRVIIIASFIIALTLSIFLIIVRYISHDVITSLNEITRLTNGTAGVLGLIPKFKEHVPISMLVVDKRPKSLMAEAFRTIRTNLQFISNTAGTKVIAVTSTVSGEGKTFVAINLGGIIAYSGKRVIILDLDMRKPKIHKGFNVENLKGMSTLLINRDSIDGCVQKSEMENLSFITAGPIPPNPSELITNGKLDELLTELKRNYDIIILDNPPVGLVSDGIETIQKADYPIYIFRYNFSKKNFTQMVDRLVNENKISKLSVLLNGVEVNYGKYGYSYRYGYRYGYGYGYGYNSNYGYYDDKPQKKKNIFARLFQKEEE